MSVLKLREESCANNWTADLHSDMTVTLLVGVLNQKQLLIHHKKCAGEIS